ncbi:MAG: Type 1 glutamine amidotransferase-like domain-containing protein, partial [Anaerolineales bacterium]|nr:Type 1 glutamine amidotransferase-like domain-containing protein [Anaerolineales bacterium]
MKDSKVWNAAQKAFARGAAYAGCSAGAMILAKKIPGMRFAGFGSLNGFGIVPATYVIPHYDAIPGVWRPIILALRRALDDGEIMLGVDENTALVGRPDEEWRVMGQGKVHVMKRDGEKAYSAGETFLLYAPAAVIGGGDAAGSERLEQRNS